MCAFRYIVVKTDKLAAFDERNLEDKDVLNHQNLFTAHNADPHNMITKLLTIKEVEQVNIHQLNAHVMNHLNHTK